MGLRQSLICSICNYKTFTSAGPDRGFMVSTNTYVCLDCKSLNDLVVRDSRLIEGELSIDNYERWKKKLEERRLLFSFSDDNEENSSEKHDYPNYEQWREEQEKLKASLLTKECSECKSVNLELWDNKGWPCPKCGTRLQPDPDGWRMNWD